MNVVRCIFDYDKIGNQKILALDSIFPIIIEKVQDMVYSILFFAVQDSTEYVYYLKVGIVAENKKDVLYIEHNPLYSTKVLNNVSTLETFKNFTKDYRKDNTYSSDLIMSRDDIKKFYFSGSGYRSFGEDEIEKVNLLISKDCFIKISLFFNKFFALNNAAGIVFGTKKLTNVQFVTIDFVKYDCSATDPGSNMVFSHYTCRKGTNVFKFTILDAKLPGRILKDGWIAKSYDEMYGKDFVVIDMVYNDKVLYMIFEERSPITDRYQSTKILIFTEDLYKNTSFLNSENIYVKEIAKDDKG